MKAIVLIIGLVLGLNSYAQGTESIVGDWKLVKLEIENQEYLRPVNDEVNSETTNFYYQEENWCWILFCYGFEMSVVLNEANKILSVSELTTLDFPQDCDLDVNNNFDDLNYYFWSNREDYENRDWYINPLQFEYEINGEGNNVELVFTNENGDKAYYNVASASTNIFEEIGVKIYPNPAQSFVSINLPTSAYQEVTINLYDITGKKLKTFTKSWSENIQLNISDLPAANYLLELNLPENTGRGYMMKLIKE